MAEDWLKNTKPQYDAVIIGSGLAGMTAANMLAKDGWSVLLVEHHHKLGGLATWFPRKGGHIFDVSLHGFPYGMVKTCRKYWTQEIADDIVQVKSVRFSNPQFELETTFDREDFAWSGWISSPCRPRHFVFCGFSWCAPRTTPDLAFRGHWTSGGVLDHSTTTRSLSVRHRAALRDFGPGRQIWLLSARSPPEHGPVKPVRPAPRAPWQNPYVERFGGTLRRELLDKIIVFNPTQLHRLVGELVAYYHQDRCHLGLEKDAPDPRRVRPRP